MRCISLSLLPPPPSTTDHRRHRHQQQQVNACVAWEMPDPSGGGVMPHIFTGACVHATAKQTLNNIHTIHLTTHVSNQHNTIPTAGDDGTVRSWQFDPANKRFAPVAALAAHTRPVTAMVLMATSEPPALLSAGGDGTIRCVLLFLEGGWWFYGCGGN